MFMLSIVARPSTGCATTARDQLMAEHEEIRQPQTVSQMLANYLDMTTPRSRPPRRRPRGRGEQEPITRPPIDNHGLDLEEGNDFA
jgi:hypothetical protein